MKVYVLSWGEFCEGGSILGIFASLEGAQLEGDRQAEARGMDRDGDGWTAYGDWMSISEHDLEES